MKGKNSRGKKGNTSRQAAVKWEKFYHVIMQTICIIIVKQKFNYVKNEVTMTDYDSSLEIETSANLLF